MSLSEKGLKPLTSIVSYSERGEGGNVADVVAAVLEPCKEAVTLSCLYEQLDSH